MTAATAVVSALAGALVSGIYTTSSTSDQIQAARDLSAHQQITQLYEETEKSDRALYSTENDFWDLFRGTVTLPSAEDIRSRAQQVKNAKERYDETASAAEIIAPSDTAEAIETNSSAHSDMSGAIDDGVRSANSITPQTASMLDDELNATANGVEGPSSDMQRLIERDLKGLAS